MNQCCVLRCPENGNTKGSPELVTGVPENGNTKGSPELVTGVPENGNTKGSPELVTGVPENGNTKGSPELVTGVPENGNTKGSPELVTPIRESIRESFEENSSSDLDETDNGLNKKKKFHGTEEDHSLAKKIYDAILIVNQTVKEPNWDRWANSIRLMREQDNRSLDDIWHVFDFANRDQFWCNNILSPDKLREKYSQLAPKAGVVRPMMVHPVGKKKAEKTCLGCYWLGSKKWFCRADGKADYPACEHYDSGDDEAG